MPILPGSIDFTDTSNNPITSITGGLDVLVVVILDTVTSSDLSVVVQANSRTVVIRGSGGAGSLTVPANSDRASVLVSTSSVSSNQVVHFTATANGTTIGADLTLTP